MPPGAKAALEASAGRVTWLAGPAQVAPGVWATGPVPRLYDQEAASGPFFLDGAGQERDPLDDDQSLWLETAKGVVVIMGCAHAGVANSLECVTQGAGARTVHAVLGGLHLKAADEGRLEFTAAALERWGVEIVAMCHCTGENAEAFLSRRLPGKAQARPAGTEWNFPLDAAGGLWHNKNNSYCGSRSHTPEGKAQPREDERWAAKPDASR